MNELWIDIIGWDGVYQVSNTNKVKSTDGYYFDKNGVKRIRKGKIRKLSIDKDGYLRVGLYKNGSQKNYRVHRLIAQAFIPNIFNLPKINHLNGIKSDNRIENLCWCTDKENTIHSYKMGLQKPIFGEDRPDVILNNSKVLQIRELYSSGKYYQFEIAKLFNVSQTLISKITLRKMWKHI